MNILKQYITKAKNQVSRVIDGEAMIILREKNKRKTEERKIIILTPMATRIWGLLDRRLKVEDFFKKVSKELNVDYKEYQNEFIEFISKLIKASLVDVSIVKRHK